MVLSEAGLARHSLDEEGLFRLVLHDRNKVLGLVLQRQADKSVGHLGLRFFREPCLAPRLETSLEIIGFKDLKQAHFPLVLFYRKERGFLAF